MGGLAAAALTAPSVLGMGVDVDYLEQFGMSQVSASAAWMVLQAGRRLCGPLPAALSLAKPMVPTESYPRSPEPLEAHGGRSPGRRLCSEHSGPLVASPWGLLSVRMRGPW